MISGWHVIFTGYVEYVDLESSFPVLSLEFQNAELFRNYLKQIREETSGRLLSVAYRPNGTPNKWWLAFAKRKFMNIIVL